MKGKVILVLLAVLIIAGCFSEKKDPVKNETLPQNEVVINKNVKVVDDNEFDSFAEINIEKNSGTIKVLKNYSKTFNNDEILTRGISEKFPFGLMAKIVNVEETDKYNIYTVTPAAISEIIEKGDINLERYFTETEIAEKKFNYSGITLETINENIKTNKRGSGTSEAVVNMVLGLNDVVLYDGDGNSETTDDRLIINGNLKVKPKARLELKFSSDDIGVKTKAGFYIENNLQGEISLKGGKNGSWEKKEATLGVVSFKPFAIIVYGVPFVFIPSVEFVVGTEGDIKTNLIFSATETVYTKVWADYEYRRSFTDIEDGINEYGNWTADMKQESDFKFQEPKFGSSAKTKVYTGIKGKISTDGMVDFYGQVNIYLRGEADIEKNPWWSLYAGVDGQAGASSFKSLPSFNKKFQFYEKKILSADGGYDEEDDGNVDLGWAKMYRKNSINDVENSFQINKTVDFEDGSVVSIGVNKKGPYNGFIMKTNNKGQILWKKSFEKEIRDIVKTEGSKVAVMTFGEVDSINKDETMVICELDSNGKEVYKKLIYNNNSKAFIPTRDSAMIYNRKTGEVLLTAKSTIAKYTDSFFMIAMKDGGVTKVKKINSLMTPNTISVKEFSLNGIDISESGEIIMAFKYGCIDNKTLKNTTNDGVALIKLDENLNIIWKKDIAMESERDLEARKVLFGILYDILDVRFDKSGNIYFVTTKILWEVQDSTGVLLTKLDNDGNEIYTTIIPKSLNAGTYFDNDGFSSEVLVYGTGLVLTPLSNGEVAMAGNPCKIDKGGLKGSELFRFDTVGNLVYYRYANIADRYFLITDIREDVNQKGIYIAGSTNGFNSYTSLVDRVQFSREPFLIYSNPDLNVSSAISNGEIQITAVNTEVWKGKVRDRKYFAADEEIMVSFDNYDQLILKDDWRAVMFKEFEELTTIKM